MMRRVLFMVLPFVASLVVAAGNAQAVVVTGAGGTFGVAAVPGTTHAQLSAAGYPPVSSGGACSDPVHWPDLSLPNTWPDATHFPLCWQGGGVLHRNETFVFTWDPLRRYWQTTKNYLEQFLRDVADGSGTLSSPYALTSQYTDQVQYMPQSQHAALQGRAENASIFGGGCTDYGSPGGFSCQFGSSNGSGQGYNYPTGAQCTYANDICHLTDGDIRSELQRTIPSTALAQHTQPGYGSLLVLLMPPGVQICLGSNLCSVGTGSTAEFCSYHSSIQGIPYVVVPWTPNTGCDEPKLPPLPANPTPYQVAVDAGVRISSPLSGGHVASIVNPFVNGWIANDGSEISDNNGCGPRGYPADKVTVGGSSQNPYYLQTEFNNAGTMVSDPNALPCWLAVSLAPTFVAPSAVNAGDEVQFDGTGTTSTLIVPRAEYQWTFGDGTTAVGPSVVHAYTQGGNYNVTLTVYDRGGNTRSFSQTVNVLGPQGQVVSLPTHGPGFTARLQLTPQGLRSALRKGFAMHVRLSDRADGIATLSIPGKAARRAHIRGKGASVVIGRGTFSGKPGTSTLHVRLSRAIARKLRRLRHLTLTIRLRLTAADGEHLTVVAAGRY